MPGKSIKIVAHVWNPSGTTIMQQYKCSGESNIANLWKDHFSAIANSDGSTDN